MASKNTAIMTARVKNGTKMTFEDAATENGLSLGKLLDVIAEAIEDQTIEIEDGRVVSISEDQKRYTLADSLMPKTKALVRMMQAKGYPDRAIEDQIDNMIEDVTDGPRYDARRAGYGC